MIVYKDLDKKLQASLVSYKVQAEVLSTLDWYRNKVMVLTRELNDLKERNEILSRQVGNLENNQSS